MWGSGVGLGVWGLCTDFPQQVSGGVGGLVPAILTFAFAVLSFVVPQLARQERGESARPDE